MGEEVTTTSCGRRRTRSARTRYCQCSSVSDRSIAADGALRCTAGARSFHLVHSKWASALRAHRPRTGCRRHRQRVGRAAILGRDELGTSDRAPGRSASRLEAQPSKIPGWLTIGATSEQLHHEQRVAMGLILFHPPRLDEADLGQHTQRSGVPVPDRGPQTSMP
jgi:hypothetical protein